MHRMMKIAGFLTIRANYPLRQVRAMFQTQVLPVRRMKEIGGSLTSRANQPLRPVQAKFQTPRLPARRMEEIGGFNQSGESVLRRVQAKFQTPRLPARRRMEVAGLLTSRVIHRQRQVRGLIQTQEVSKQEFSLRWVRRARFGRLTTAQVRQPIGDFFIFRGSLAEARKPVWQAFGRVWSGGRMGCSRRALLRGWFGHDLACSRAFPLTQGTQPGWQRLFQIGGIFLGGSFAGADGSSPGEVDFFQFGSIPLDRLFPGLDGLENLRTAEAMTGLRRAPQN